MHNFEQFFFSEKYSTSKHFFNVVRDKYQLFFPTGLNYITDNWLRIQVAAKPMLPSSVTNSKFKSSLSKFELTKSKVKETAATMRPKMYSKHKSGGQPSNKSNTRGGSFLKTGKISGKDTAGKTFVYHIKRQTQRRDFERSSKYGDYQQEEESEFLSGSEEDNDNYDNTDNNDNDNYDSKAPELENENENDATVHEEEASTAAVQAGKASPQTTTLVTSDGQALPETTVSTTSVTTTSETPLETTLQCFGPFCIG